MMPATYRDYCSGYEPRLLKTEEKMEQLCMQPIKATPVLSEGDRPHLQGVTYNYIDPPSISGASLKFKSLEV